MARCNSEQQVGTALAAPSPPGNRQRAGQSTIEFAAAATIFPILMFGMMELATAVYTYSTVNEAAQEAVRYAVVNGPGSPSQATNAQVAAVAQAYAPGLNLNTTVSWPNDSNIAGAQDAKVVVTCSYPLNIPFMKAQNLNFSASYQIVIPNSSGS